MIMMMMILMTISVSRKPFMKPIYKAYWDVPVYAESMEVSQLDRYVRMTNLHSRKSRKVMLLEMKNPWVENREAIKEQKTWRLDL